MSSSEMRDLDDAALVHLLLGNERELVSSRFRHSLNKLENTASLRVLRRDIARARTELRSREVAQGLGPNAIARQHRGSFVAGVESGQGATKGGFLSGVVDKLTADE